MWPFSYSRCAVDIVYLAEKPSLRDASCCSVVVRNGAYGDRRYGLRSTLLTVKGTPVSRSARPGADIRWTTPAGEWPLAAAPAPARARAEPLAGARAEAPAGAGPWGSGCVPSGEGTPRFARSPA